MRVLMCPSKYFDVSVEDEKLNPWMSMKRKPVVSLASSQWNGLKDLYKTLGIEVHRLFPNRKLFDQVFTANLGWGIGDLMAIANLAPEWRGPETVIAQEWFENHGFNTQLLPVNLNFEGQGDVISIGKAGHLFCYGIRNHLEVKDFLELTFGINGEMIPLKLVTSKYYHGDVCIRYSKNRNAILYNPSAFDAESLRLIERLPLKKMEAPKELWVQETEIGRNFPLNGCYVGKVETFPWNNSFGKFPVKVREWIEADGGEIWLQNFDQFGLSGAGHRCCTFFLD